MVVARGLAAQVGGFRLGTLDLDLPAGAFGTLLGPSGAGKTTLLRALAGLVPTSGEVTLGRARCESLPPEQRPIGWVPQGGGLFPHLSARGNVELVRTPGAPSAEALLERVGALDLASRNPTTLSGGEVLRVALARALGREPQVLLLDEPLAAIDRSGREPLLKLLVGLAGAGTTVLQVTHDPDQALAVATWLGILEAGRLVAAGPIAQLLENTLPVAARQALGGDNLLVGRFEPLSEGLSQFRTTTLALSVPGELRGAGCVIFSGAAVGMARQTESGTSVRNQVASQVRLLEGAGPTVEVHLAGGVLALVTREAVRELGLEIGARVVLEIKATAIRPLLRPY